MEPADAIDRYADELLVTASVAAARFRSLDQEQVDRIVQVTVPKVDVLWCVDNSSSMEDEQSALVQAFPVFADWFAVTRSTFPSPSTSAAATDDGLLPAP